MFIKDKSKLLQEASEILSKLDHYHTIAKNINDNEIASNERTPILDNISYGEEEIRASEAISELKQAMSNLQDDEQLNKLEDAINNAKITYDDLIALSEN